MDLFAQATRNKLRFPGVKGQINTEDLWDLTVPALKTIARGYYEELKTTDLSFLDEVTEVDAILQLKFDVVKFIIETKQTEEKERKLAAERRKAKEELLELKKEKQKELMKGMTLEEIDKQLELL
jgi:hypothetical protein